jgi:hypothetical protein
MSSKPFNQRRSQKPKTKPTVYRDNNKKYVVIDEDKALRDRFPDPAERKKYVDELNESVSQPGFIEALYEYFLTRDISGFDPNVIQFEHETIDISRG